MRIYYAHAKCTYGSPTEKTEKKQIKAVFPKCKIIDPGKHEGNIEKTTKEMKYCYGLISTCDALVFSRLLRRITSGVGKEIKYALRNGIRVYELRGKNFKSIKKSLPYLSRKNTIRLYRRWRLMNPRMRVT